MKGLVLIMARFCEKCGTQLEGVEAFCPNCGAPVAAEPETTAAETAAETVAAEINAAETAAAPAAPAEESGSADGAPATFEYSEPAAPAPAAAPEAAENAQQGFAYGAPAAPAPAQPQYQTAQPQYQQAQPQYTVPAAAPQPDQTVSTARFFWFRILFAIPFVGFILSIIMSFAPRNINFKHFARSYMIMNFIGIGIVILVLVIALASGAALSDIFRDIPDISYMF